MEPQNPRRATAEGPACQEERQYDAKKAAEAAASLEKKARGGRGRQIGPLGPPLATANCRSALSSSLAASAAENVRVENRKS